MQVSIHVPARGTTRSGDSLRCGSFCFNPRSRTGNDVATSQHRKGESICFNPRSRTGNDHSSFPIHHPYERFNPRSRTGNDRFLTSKLPVFRCFNPRSRTGNDHASFYTYNKYLQVSIHVPARGTTRQRRSRHLLRTGVSIHVPARGTTKSVTTS